MFAHKSGLDQARLTLVFEGLVNEFSYTVCAVGTVDLELQRLRLCCRKIIAHGIKIDSSGLCNEIIHAHAPPRALQRNGRTLVIDFKAAAYLHGIFTNDILRDADHILVVSVGFIEFNAGELGVVARADAFIAEDSPELEHPLESTDHHPLEVQLRGDAQVELHIQRIVVRDKGASIGTPNVTGHHGSLDFDIVAILQIAAHALHDGCAFAERVADLSIHNQVHIAPPVPDIYVGEPLKLVGKRQDGLGEHRPLVHHHR
mmetsp:Transcript_91884/g.134285  ORF Transcript_91884/g.134285 Transcript_91884/m.134285 type:complete len:259 (+) Transcript_91884:432-1208(+)